MLQLLLAKNHAVSTTAEEMIAGVPWGMTKHLKTDGGFALLVQFTIIVINPQKKPVF